MVNIVQLDCVSELVKTELKNEKLTCSNRMNNSSEPSLAKGNVLENGLLYSEYCPTALFASKEADCSDVCVTGNV